MAIDKRIVTIPEIYAENAQTNIPVPPVPGTSYRDLAYNLWANGISFTQIADSSEWNQLFYVLTSMLQQAEQFSFLPYSEFTSYPVGGTCTGTDGIQYKAIKENGPDYPDGVKDPTTEEAYWKSTASSDNPLLYPSAFVTLYEQTPPDKFAERNGALVSNASTAMPALYAALQLPENAWKLKTEAEWQAMSTAVPFSGIGGVPFFVLDEVANTIRLPDTRGMYEEGAGFDGLTVGGVHGDMIRDIEGSFKMTGGSAVSTGTGVFTVSGSGGIGTEEGVLFDDVFFAARNVVPVGNANKPRGYGVLHCVYTG